MPDFIFTFGHGHTHPATGEPLHRRFVTISADTPEAAREEMVRRFGREWGFQYASREKAGVERFGLEELGLESDAEWRLALSRYIDDAKRALGPGWHVTGQPLAEAIAQLVAEVEHLRAALDAAHAQIDEARADLDRLRAIITVPK